MIQNGVIHPRDQNILYYSSGVAASLGNNTCISPAAGKSLRCSYLSYDVSAQVLTAFRFGPAGILFLRNNPTANSIIAKDFGDFRYIQGAVDEALIINLGSDTSVIWNVFYVEV